MLIQRFVCQPDIQYRELIREAAAAANFESVDGAFAYASGAGVGLLTEALQAQLPCWEQVDKRWLLGVDWCRTEPRALELLDDETSSAVRIADGDFVVGRPGCTPRLPWHPKVLILRGRDAIGVVSGSGNLSRNGMTRGHEVGSFIVVSNPRNASERTAHAACVLVADWFEATWRTAVDAASITAAYEARYRDAARGFPPVTDEDTLPERSRRWITAERLRKLRTADHLWIEAGNLHKNRGPLQRGNQLMMSPMTRVYFGFPAEDLATDSSIGSVAIRYEHATRWDSPIRFSNNSMDVLALPVPDAGGPPSYDQNSLLFRRVQDDGRIIFEMTLGSAADRRVWRRRSRAIGGAFTMQGRGREWGVF